MADKYSYHNCICYTYRLILTNPLTMGPSIQGSLDCWSQLSWGDMPLAEFPANDLENREEWPLRSLENVGDDAVSCIACAQTISPRLMTSRLLVSKLIPGKYKIKIIQFFNYKNSQSILCIIWKSLFNINLQIYVYK